MQAGSYDEPKNPLPIRAKVLCVIVVYVPPGKKESWVARSSHDPKDVAYYDENKLETVKFTLACHEHYDPGVDYDIVLINNGTRDPETLEFLKNYKGKRVREVCERENVGFSFGGFKWAWERYGEEYDYYLFTEQDGAPSKDGWLAEIVQTFLSDRQIGAVGNFVEARHLDEAGEFFQRMRTLHPTLKDRDWMCNLDGFMTFTSSAVLRRCGELFVFPVRGNTDEEYDAVWNELCFQQPILESGYKIVSFFDGKHIIWKGEYVKDSDPCFDSLPMEQIAPVVLGHVRNLDPRAKEHFNWYHANI